MSMFTTILSFLWADSCHVGQLVFYFFIYNLFLSHSCGLQGQKLSGVGVISEKFFLLPYIDLLGMRVNINKTKVMISGEWQKARQKAVRWPCGVCGRGIGSNSIQCIVVRSGYTGNVVVLRVAYAK